jgi:hypothetical protein
MFHELCLPKSNVISQVYPNNKLKGKPSPVGFYIKDFGYSNLVDRI